MNIRCLPVLLACATIAPLAAQTETAAPTDPGGFAHADAVLRVDYVAAGKWLVSTDGHTVKAWSVSDGGLAATQAVPNEVQAISGHPIDPLVAVLNKGNLIELRSLPDLALVRSWNAEDAQELEFSPSGDVLATCAYTGIRFWNTNDGTLTKWIKLSEDLMGLAFSPDGKWLVTAGTRYDRGGATLSIWRLGDYARVQDMGGDAGAFYRATFTPDGQQVVAGSNNDQISLWRIPSGRRAAIREGFPRGLWNVTAGADGKTLLSADGNRVRLWNLSDCSLRKTFEGHTGSIKTIVASPDGLSFATAGKDRTIRLWQLADGAPVRSLVDPDADKKPVPAVLPSVPVAASTPTQAGEAETPGLVVSGRLLDESGKPVANVALKLPLAYPQEKGGLLYMFAPHFLEATTDADGRFMFKGVKAGKKYALVHMAGNNLSPLKRTDGSIVILDIHEGVADIELGDIPFERR
jgi:hypothetical protein